MLRIRALLEENYLPATGNRMLSALRGVLRECWHWGLLSLEEYHLAIDVEPIRGESEPAGATSPPTSCGGCSRPAPALPATVDIDRTR